MRTQSALVLIFSLVLAACGREPSTSEAELVTAEPGYRETGDLAALKERGQFRILVHQAADDYLPRAGYPLDIEKRMAERFAREQGLEPVLVPVDNYGGLLDALLAGQGDVVAANLTLTPSRSERAGFTIGIDETREVIVGRQDGPSAATLADLAGHSVGVMRDTSFWELAQARFTEESGVEVVPLASTLTSDGVLDGLAAGQYDFVLQDSNVMDVVATYRDDVQTLFAMGKKGPWPGRCARTTRNCSMPSTAFSPGSA